MHRAHIAIFITILLGLGVAATAHDDTARVRHLWTVSEGLLEPESVVVDEARGHIYVSNVVGYGLNGQGYISRLSMSGRMIDEKWVADLNGPTGMVLVDDRLYFADVDSLKVLDIATATVVESYQTFHERPCLNDVAVAEDGIAFVSGSCNSTIYRLSGSALMPFIEDASALRFVNGLFVSGEMLLSGGWEIRLWNRYTGKPLADGPVTRQGDVKDIDGMAWDGSGFLLSMVDDPRLWRLGSDGKAHPVSDDAFHAADFFYDDVTGLLIVPQNPGNNMHSVSAYRLTFE